MRRSWTLGWQSCLEANGLTRTGSTLGTAAYMSPEQPRGEDLDERTSGR